MKRNPSSKRNSSPGKPSGDRRKTGSKLSGTFDKKSSGRGLTSSGKETGERTGSFTRRGNTNSDSFQTRYKTTSTEGSARSPKSSDLEKPFSGKGSREKKTFSADPPSKDKRELATRPNTDFKKNQAKKFSGTGDGPKAIRGKKEGNAYDERRSRSGEDDFSMDDDAYFLKERRHRSNNDDWNFGKDEFSSSGKSTRGKKIEIQKAINKGTKSTRESLSEAKGDLSEGMKSFGKFYAEPDRKTERKGLSRRSNQEEERRPVNKFYDKKFEKGGKPKSSGFSKKNETLPDIQNDEIRLNRYLSLAGICSRRDADEFIKAGAVTVNGKVVVEMGYRVKPGDEVVYGGLGIRPEKPVYLLLNKPKDYITTSDDPQNRKTVLQLIEGACKERVYPVGRLDRNTTGLLLFTNDGEMAKKLTHPSSMIQKMYHVVLDKPLTAADKTKISAGLTLEDGPVKVDEINYVDNAGSKKEVGVVIHSGRNRIVRRIFEELGYAVVKLDRVMFAGLTKKDLPKGKWRMLTRPELNLLKML